MLVSGRINGAGRTTTLTHAAMRSPSSSRDRTYRHPLLISSKDTYPNNTPPHEFLSFTVNVTILGSGWLNFHGILYVPSSPSSCHLEVAAPALPFHFLRPLACSGLFPLRLKTTALLSPCPRLPLLALSIISRVGNDTFFLPILGLHQRSVPRSAI